jgi:hypothetical protein
MPRFVPFLVLCFTFMAWLRALGAKFDRQAFNDFVIGQGLLPPALLAKAVREAFIPAQQRKN